MLVSYKWIREFVDTGLTVDEAAHELTMAGLEIEGIERAGDDHVLEVNVTPDRADCLSVLGIARELSAITGAPLTLPEHGVSAKKGSDFRIELLDTGLCPRYAGRVIRGIKIAESPRWIKDRLENCGIRSINNIVDITNYVLLEFGHPLHAFDLDTLRGGTIRVGVAGKDNSITTLDGVERKLPEDALLIWDAERPVAVAGVMGGADTEVSESTTDIFIESACFKPQSVRRTSKALGLKTEAAYRFERGTDIVMLEHALDRAAHLVLQLAGGEAEEMVDAYPVKFRSSPITVKYEKVNRVLGTSIPDNEMLDILRRLNLETRTNGDSFEVTPPSYRPDLTIDADIIAEVARLYGYGRIPTVVPREEISFTGSLSRRRLVSAVKEAMRKEGFHEAVNYSFMNTDYLDVLGIPEGDSRRRCVEIKNPLRKEDSHLRTMLTPSLLENFRYNFSRGVKDIRLFEIARVFEQSGAQLPSERLRLGGICFREDAPSLYRETTEGFFLIKGAVESVMDRLRVEDYTFTPSKEPFLHPGKSADISIAGCLVGFAGVLSPSTVEKLDVKTGQEVLLFELDMEAVLEAVPESAAYRQIPKFPAIERDIAILLDVGITSAEVTGLIWKYPSEFVEDVSVFDSYKGRNIPQGKRSLAVSVLYRSPDRTLTDEEVESIHKGLVEYVVGRTGGEIRG